MVHLTSTHFCLTSHIIQLKSGLAGFWPSRIFFIIGYLFFPFSCWQLHFVYGESDELTDRQSKYKILKGQTGKAHFSISAPQTVISQMNHKGGQKGEAEDYTLKWPMP